VLGRSASRTVTPAPATPAAPEVERPPGAPDDGVAASVTAEHAAAVVEGRIPNVVSAAWELELLIAGAVTFALFQLPGALNSLREWLTPRVSGAGEIAVFMGLLYAKAIVYALIGAFVTNLAARAYWVGLVGLHSVYPRGVRWDQLGMGPLSVAMYRERIASLPAVMSRVDNFASVIFSFAFLIVATFLISVLVFALLGGIAYVISAVFFDGAHVARMLYGAAAVGAVVMAAVGLTDKYAGSRLDPSGRAHRWLRSALRVTARTSGMTLMAPIFFTLLSNIGRHRVMLLFYVAFLGSISIGMFDFLRSVGALRSGWPRFVPAEEDVRGVDASHYESLAGRNAFSMVPTIQSDVITSPYVRLFVPYIADRHEPALESGCPGLVPMQSGRPHLRRRSASGGADTVAADRALACLRTMHAIALDGTPRPDVPFRYYVHPVTGRHGLIAYIPTAPLASGMHTLTVMQPPREPDSERKNEPLEPYEIVFWK
jgi:hypothetical protein